MDRGPRGSSRILLLLNPYKPLNSPNTNCHLMPLLRPSPSISRSAQSIRYTTTRATARTTLDSRTLPPPFPVIPSCPSPTCPCSSTPPNLDIDYKQPLNGTMSPYAQHLIISTGNADWTSRIEDEKDTAAWGKFTADVRAMLGRGGEFHDVRFPYSSGQDIGGRRQSCGRKGQEKSRLTYTSTGKSRLSTTS